jgi:chromosome segregation ATPase
VVTDPGAAEQFPPPVLVSTILECEAENRALRRRLTARRQELQELKQGMADHVVEDAELRGRLRTLEEVIAALHANIEDLRLQRDQLLGNR